MTPRAALASLPKIAVTSTAMDRGRPVMPMVANVAMAAAPLTNQGCVLRPPPTTVKIGDLFSVNILDWKKAAFETGPSIGPITMPDKLVYEIALSLPRVQWVEKQYLKLSEKKFTALWQHHRHAQPPGRLVTFDLPSRTIRMPATSMGGTINKFSQSYKGFSVPFNLPAHAYNELPPGTFWIWQDVVNGKIPIAKVKPPFPDDNHEWGVFVEWLNRKKAIKNFATNAMEEHPIVKITLKQLSRGFMASLSDGLGDIVEAFAGLLEFLCEGVTAEKLQDVRNYGTAFPQPQVQAGVMAWQGAAQACGLAFPANATAMPNCADTGAPDPGLPAPLSWWEQHKNWLIGGGIALAGAITAVVVLRRQAS